MLDFLAQAAPASPSAPTTDGTWSAVLSLGQWVLNGVLSLAWYWLSRKTTKVEQLEHELKQRTEEHVNQKLETVVVKLTSTIDIQNTLIKEIRQRLDSGESTFHALGHRDQQTELKLMATISELKDYIHTNCADKNDVHRLTSQVNELSRSMAELKASV